MHRSTLALAASFSLTGCLAISHSEASSEANASVIIRGGDGQRLCAPEDGGDGGDSAWIIVRSGEDHSELYAESVLGSVLATAGAGGAGGASADAAVAPGEPGAPGAAGGVEVQPLDCDLSDDPVDPGMVQILSTPFEQDVCLFTVDTPAGSVVRVGVPGQEDVLPESGTVVVEMFHVGPGAELVVRGDLTVYADRFILESGAEVRTYAGSSFAVLTRDEADAYEDIPGESGGWLTVIAEEVELGGHLTTRGNPGGGAAAGGDAGRLVVFAGSLRGVLGAERAFPTGALDARGGDGGDGADAAPCD